MPNCNFEQAHSNIATLLVGDADNSVGGCDNVRFIIGEVGVVGDFYFPHE